MFEKSNSNCCRYYSKQDALYFAFLIHFWAFITQVGTLGAVYQPTNPIAPTAAMQGNLDEILPLRAAWQAKKANEENSRNTRENLYNGVSTRASDLVNYCRSLGLDENELANLRSFARRIRGKRAAPVSPAPVGAPAPRRISAAQTTYAGIAEHFANLVEAVGTRTDFDPPENQFKMTTLQTFVDSLRQANDDVETATAETSVERLALDRRLYTGEESAIKAVSVVKPYVRAVFGKDHPVYRTISKLSFRLPRRLQ